MVYEWWVDNVRWRSNNLAPFSWDNVSRQMSVLDKDRRVIGKLHRDGDKPALINSDAGLEWFVHGRRHRDGDKPAVMHNGGHEKWFHGRRVFGIVSAATFTQGELRFAFVAVAVSVPHHD